jgi:hypothetical protein
MKLKTVSGRKIEVSIERISFGVYWLRVGRDLVGLNHAQLLDAEFSLTRVEIITGITLAPGGPNDVYFEWPGIVRDLELEFARRELPRGEPHGLRVVPRKVQQVPDEWE